MVSGSLIPGLRPVNDAGMSDLSAPLGAGHTPGKFQHHGREARRQRDGIGFLSGILRGAVPGESCRLKADVATFLNSIRMA